MRSTEAWRSALARSFISCPPPTASISSNHQFSRSSLAISVTVAHHPASPYWLPGIRRRKFNFQLASKRQLHPGEKAHSAFAHFRATPLRDDSFFGFVDNSADGNVEFVAHPAAPLLVGRRRNRNGLDCHRAR